ncbi:hypothetical protein [Oryzibacter oryziterrae]|uniref:hypothetical protein n=1 Tax=Oryzibacter oryziterrae TaxID=2766474 RepID=UPI001F1FE225|nr:hypothetical protein [Oryzibacter oryziterrae]
MPEHFSVGDPVVYFDETIGTTLNCRITKVMPKERYGLYYHIRDLSERYERSVPENTLVRRDLDMNGTDGVMAN